MTIASHLAELRKKHETLSEMVELAQRSPGTDDLQIADLKNTSSIRGAGASTAAEFLRSFVEGTDWAHLDIAGSAFVENGGRMYFGHGATGAGVRLLTNYLSNQ